MEPSARHKLLWNVKRDLGIYIQFPMQGEPKNKYAEQNRQMYIRRDNEVFKNGWLPPAGNLGWWRLRIKGSSEPVTRPDFIPYVLKVRD